MKDKSGKLAADEVAICQNLNYIFATVVMKEADWSILESKLHFPAGAGSKILKGFIVASEQLRQCKNYGKL